MDHYKYSFTDSLQSLMIGKLEGKDSWIFHEVEEYFTSKTFHSVMTKSFHSVTMERTFTWKWYPILSLLPDFYQLKFLDFEPLSYSSLADLCNMFQIGWKPSIIL